MNERIEQLAIETFFDESTNGGDQKMYTFGEDKMQKFAELIVLECIRQIDDMIDDGWYADTDKLKQHFGIGE